MEWALRRTSIVLHGSYLRRGHYCFLRQCKVNSSDGDRKAAVTVSGEAVASGSGEANSTGSGGALPLVKKTH